MSSAPGAPSLAPLGGRARWAIVVIVLVIVWDVFEIGADGSEIALLDRVIEGDDVPLSELEASDDRQRIAGFGGLAIFVVAAVFFLRWFHAAYRNLTALGAAGQRYTPGWAIGSWFVPFLNLVRPKRMADDIWRAGDPSYAVGSSEWRLGSVPKLLNFWWGLWIASFLIANVATRAWAGAEDAESLRTATGADAFAQAVDIAAAVLAILVIRRLTARQTERSQFLDRGAVADVPVAARTAVSAAVARLVIVNDDGTDGASFRLAGEQVIGREAADILLDDPEISRTHARVRVTGDRVEITDLGSSNGTKVNDERIAGTVDMRHGDSVTVGGTRLRLENPRETRDPDATVVVGDR